jgi:hypothetical protein
LRENLLSLGHIDEGRFGAMREVVWTIADYLVRYAIIVALLAWVTNTPADEAVFIGFWALAGGITYLVWRIFDFRIWADDFPPKLHTEYKVGYFALAICLLVFLVAFPILGYFTLEV